MKPSKRPAGPILFWHPNFRIASSLPDTKVIRTSFAVNAVAVAVTLGLGALVIQQQMQIAEVTDRCAEWQATADGHRPRFEKAAQLQKEFAEGEKKVRQIDEFVTPRLQASDLLVLIAETLPRLIILDAIEMYGDGVRLRGTVVDASASIAKGYADQLAASPAITALMESVRLSSQNRDQGGNRFTFEIDMKLKGQKTPAPKPPPAPKPKAEDE